MKIFIDANINKIKESEKILAIESKDLILIKC